MTCPTLTRRLRWLRQSRDLPVQLSSSEVLIGIGCACVRAFIEVSVLVFVTGSRKKKYECTCYCTMYKYLQALRFILWCCSMQFFSCISRIPWLQGKKHPMFFTHFSGTNTTRNIHLYDKNFNDESKIVIKIAFYDENFGFVIDHCDEPRTPSYLWRNQVS